MKDNSVCKQPEGDEEIESDNLPLPITDFMSIIEAAQPMSYQHVNKISYMLIEIFYDEGGDMSKVKKYKVPKGFEKAWEAGIKALEDAQ